ncbi:uncharacterized protein LOC127247831 isoform X2 [Andrographis paniculata]|uniref:uncharacterized protein LOC127247831 isoform X2 n=1 Tax=Andrographis paniculata TaxID=175694 RepID=UPI0021E7E63C|nr:uncharacterized protein LOC127247831 isoform X2 [Andrographis paniculata]
MESQIVKRRVNVIAGHLASPDDVSATPGHVFPMNCSNTLNPVNLRRDNITFFARQGSGSQGGFMRQISSPQQDFSNTLNPVSRRFDNRTFFARQGSDSQGGFMRQETNVQFGKISKSNSCGEMQPNGPDAPAFARPAQVKPGIPTVKSTISAVEGCQYNGNALEAPIFAKPSIQCGQPQCQNNESTDNFTSKESEWSPKMDVVESGFNYVVTLEIPGISIDKLKVEVNNQSLIVTGHRSNWSCEAANLNKSDSLYHRREMLQGPYRVVWQLPSNANKENVSAEIQDGLLRVTIPKLSALIWLRKVHV